MKHIKRIAAAVLALCALLALTACGGLQEKVESKLWETAAPILVRGTWTCCIRASATRTI